MRGLRSTLILLVAAVGLGAYLYFVDSKNPVLEENAKKKVFSYEADKIDQIQIKSASGEVTALRKDSSGWAIVKPVAAPADQSTVNDVVTSLANLEEDRVVEENATDLTPFGLADPRIDVTFNVSGEKEQKRVLIGDKNPTNVGLYAKLPNDSRVFLVAYALDNSLNRSTFDLRDKTALKFQQTDVDSVELVSRNAAIRLEKSGDEWKIVKPITAPADFVTVNGLIGQLQSAQMATVRDAPEEMKDLKPFGLDRPAVTATLGMGAQRVTFELGTNADAGTVWARDPSKPMVFSVANGIAEMLHKTPFELRRKEIFEFRPFNAVRFEMIRGKDTRAFERVKGTGENAIDSWKQIAPENKTVDASNFEGALLEFSNLRAEAALDAAGPTTGLNNPIATVIVRFDDGKKEERVTIGRVGQDVFASRPDQPGALKLEVGQYDSAVKKLDSIQ
jgi:hypothetical protein